MTERSLFWEGQVLGDCGPYDEDDFTRFFASLLNGTGDQGILLNWLNELEVTGATSPLTVATGGAVVQGGLYENTAAVSVSVSTPSSGLSRYDRIVLRREWAGKTIRIARVAGTAAASPAIPALTQADGVRWEVPLATVLVDDTGACAVTDARDWCEYTTQWPANSVQDDAFQAGAVTAAKIPDRTRYITKGAGQLIADVAGAVGPTWTDGGVPAAYDYWEFADGQQDRCWLFESVPFDQAGVALTINVWSTPDVAAAGNCEWEYEYGFVMPGNAISLSAVATTTVAQGGRVVDTAYRDQLVAIAAGAGDGQLFVLRLGRDGAGDSYNNAMRLLGVELEWTAEA